MPFINRLIYSFLSTIFLPWKSPKPALNENELSFVTPDFFLLYAFANIPEIKKKKAPKSFTPLLFTNTVDI